MGVRVRVCACARGFFLCVCVIAAYFRKLKNRCLAKTQKYHFASRSHESPFLRHQWGPLSPAYADLAAPGALSARDLKHACWFPRIVPSNAQPVGSGNSSLKINDSLACSSLMQVFRAAQLVCACVRTRINRLLELD